MRCGGRGKEWMRRERVPAREDEDEERCGHLFPFFITGAGLLRRKRQLLVACCRNRNEWWRESWDGFF
jgi:hypothetical protein